MTLRGKGIYIWKLPAIAGGDIDRMVEKAQAAGLSHVIIKIADGTRNFNEELAIPAVNAFRSAGIETWGWAWIWLEDPEREAGVAAHRCLSLGLDGFVINAEYPASGKPNQAISYMDVINNELADLPVALSSYRYPQHHRSLPWEIFLSKCQIDMPQMYWVGEEPKDCVRTSLTHHEAFPFSKPIVPTGAAYGERYGNRYFRAQPEEIWQFLDSVREHDLQAANFWSWDWTEAYGSDLWNAIADYDWPVEEIEMKDVAERYWEAFSSKNLEVLEALYLSNAVYIAASASVQGPSRIRTALSNLLELLPEAQFEKSQLCIEGNIRQLNWSAISSTGKVINGTDTIGVRLGKIQYHTSSYLYRTQT